jgi:monoamine oxidase
VTEISQTIVVLGAGINGQVATNYLVRAGHQVTLLGRSDRVRGNCGSRLGADVPLERRRRVLNSCNHLQSVFNSLSLIGVLNRPGFTGDSNL